MRKLLILVPFVMVGLLAGTYGAYTFQQSSPAHSLKLIRMTIADHDWEGFRNYVNVDGIIESAAEDILTEKVEQDKEAYSMQQMTENYEEKLKPEFVGAMGKAFADYVSKGRIKFPEDKELTDTERLIKRAQTGTIHISSISKPLISGDTATTSIEFYNPELKISFEMEAELERDGDLWKIKSVTGWKECVKSVERAMTAKLNRLNSPIQQKLNEIMDIKVIQAEIVQGDEYGFSEIMRMNIKADIKSDKPLDKIYGRMKIDVPDGEELFTPFEVDMAFKPQGVQDIAVDKVLNPFVRSDVKIMRRGLRKSAISPQITGVLFRDGTKLELLTELPD